MPLTAGAAPDILYAFCHLILQATELAVAVGFRCGMWGWGWELKPREVK